MRTRYFVLAAALSVPSAFAAPAQTSALSKRDEKTWDSKGNIKLTFSKDTVKIGDLKLEDMFSKLAEVCHESGQCETNDIEFDSWRVDAGNNAYMGPLTVTMGPHGSYPTWIRNGLVDTLKAAVLAGAKCGEVTNRQMCQGGDKGCQMVTTRSNQCEVPKFWGINYQDPNEGNAAPPSMSADIKTDPADSEACKDMMDMMGTIAGAVNGAAGGIFSLISLMCT